VPPAADSTYRASWEQAVHAYLDREPVESIRGPVAVHIQVGLPSTPCPLEADRPLLPLLLTRRVIEKASDVASLTMIFDRTVVAGLMRVRLWRTISPASRLGAAERRNAGRRIVARWAAP